MATGVTWDSKLAAVAGSSASKIEKAFGYRTVGDLLSHYPRRYVERGSVSDLGSLTLDEHITFVGRVVHAETKTYPDRRRGGLAYRREVTVATENDRLALTFFDKKPKIAEWRAETIVVGAIGMFSGKVGRFKNDWQLTNPQTEIFGAGREGEADAARAEVESLPDLLPIYPATSTVQSWQLERSVKVALEMLVEAPDVLPDAVRREHGLVDARKALEWIHRPDTWEQKGAAEKRLRFDEAFVTQTALALRRASLEALDATPRAGRECGLLDRFDERLPFTLTAGQQQVSDEALRDLAAGHPMHRLLQGEVGSGKTVVALRAMLRVVDSGGQAALLAPTEVLAQQHARSITAMLGDLAAGGMLGGDAEATQVVLLTGSTGAAARRQTLSDIQVGNAGIVVGTHALLEDKVKFLDLGLVVVDEQHRFGVEQRAALTDKAGEAPPHVLVMTATPIPRTVAMTVFGDLETSTLTELPQGRAPIQTNVVPLRDHPGWFDRVWQRLREEVDNGRQCYVVCPRIDTGDDDGDARGDVDESPKSNLASVAEVAAMLEAGPLHGLRIAQMHGRLAPDDKDAIMRSFAAGDVDVLVSTTVIEVGVDVGNATAMVILDADRFGVSQLHQMRGRVGRGGHPGLCLLVTTAEAGSPARERLEAVASTTDGFELSRLDLEHRREGDVLGTSQSGRRSGLKLLSVIRHEDVIADARAAAEKVVADDPTLEHHPALLAEVERLRETEQADYLEKA
jgi:ATP-dependent DNA helicase RecG